MVWNVEIPNVTQNNIGMYIKGCSQQSFEIPNNLDVKFEWAYQNHKNEIVLNMILT